MCGWRQVASGIGTVLAGGMLASAGFPDGAEPGDPALCPTCAPVVAMGNFYVPAVFALDVLGVLTISFYQISRRSHQETIEELAAAKAGRRRASLFPPGSNSDVHVDASLESHTDALADDAKADVDATTSANGNASAPGSL